MKTNKNESPFGGQGGFENGLNVFPTKGKLGFDYGDDCFGPIVENRTLESIRKSLADPICDGPEIVYSHLPAGAGVDLCVWRECCLCANEGCERGFM